MLTQSRRDEERACTQNEWVTHLHIPSTITDLADTLWYIQVLKTYNKSPGELDAKAMGLATKTIKNFSGLGTFASKNKSLAGMKHFADVSQWEDTNHAGISYPQFCFRKL